MTPEQRLNAANEINGLWVRHVRHGEAPPDLNSVARILERHELSPVRPRNSCVVRLKLVDSAGS